MKHFMVKVGSTNYILSCLQMRERCEVIANGISRRWRKIHKYFVNHNNDQNFDALFRADNLQERWRSHFLRWRQTLRESFEKRFPFSEGAVVWTTLTFLTAFLSWASYLKAVFSQASSTAFLEQSQKKLGFRRRHPMSHVSFCIVEGEELGGERRRFISTRRTFFLAQNRMRGCGRMSNMHAPVPVL